MTRVPKLNQFFILIIFIWLYFIEFTIVNCRLPSSSSRATSKKDSKQLPIDTHFELPAPLPQWPPGTNFATGFIDLGALQVAQIPDLDKIWATYEGSWGNLGATFYEPAYIPEGFHMLGCYSQPNNEPLNGWVLVAKDVSLEVEPAGLVMPVDYTLLWSSASGDIKQDNVGYIWLPVAPDNYSAIGYVVTTSSEKPPLDKIRVVRSVLAEDTEMDTWLWGSKTGLNVYSSRPVNRGSNALGLSTGTFMVEKDGNTLPLSCLTNLNLSFPSMPNLDQVQALIKTYGPVVYLHPDENYLPSSVSWFFNNGALLYTKGQESNPVQIDNSGSNLPQNGSDDGAYWIDLPTDETSSKHLKEGNLESAKAYMHIKTALGGTFTDIAVWFFYPFNGAGKIQVAWVTISLTPVGQHVGDWEHVTLRISNFNGELKSVYFSQHDKGRWVSTSSLEFDTGNKPVVYASLHGHASYPKPGVFIHAMESGLIVEDKLGGGARNDTLKSNLKMDTWKQFWLLGADYLGGLGIVEEPWLNYAREWGPKKYFLLGRWIQSVEKSLPGELKTLFEKIVKSLPPELLGEEGPTGPKWKDNWNGDERPGSPS